MRVIAVAALAVVGVIGYRAIDMMSSDALGLALGILLGIMAGLPMRLLAAAAERNQARPEAVQQPDSILTDHLQIFTVHSAQERNYQLPEDSE